MPAQNLVLDDFFPFRLAVASNAVSDMIANAYETKHNLKIPEWRLVAILHEDGPSTQQAIVKRGGMDKVTISRAAQALAKRRLIERVPHEHDGRSHHLSLTKDGEKLFADIAPTAMAYEKTILNGLAADDILQLKILLRRVEDTALKSQNNV